MNSLGYRIRLFRKHLHLKQEEFAEKMSVARLAVGQWENDKSVPDTVRLVAMRDLGLNIDWLLAGEGSMLRRDSSLEDNVVRHSDLPVESMKIWLTERWSESGESEREFIRMLFGRVFPEYTEWLKKNYQPMHGNSTIYKSS